MRALRLAVLLAIAAGLIVVLVSRDQDNDPTDVELIATAIDRVATTTDPAYCTDAVTVAYLEQRTGYEGRTAVADCRDTARQGVTASSVSVTGVEVDGDSAVATTVTNGGALDDATSVVHLVDDGGWKLDRVESIEGVDRVPFERAYARQLTASPYDFSAKGAACVTDAVFGETPADLEAAVIEGDPVRGTAAMARCERERVEALLETAVDTRAGAGVKRCVLSVAVDAPVAELARMYGDPATFGELLSSCGGPD